MQNMCICVRVFVFGSILANQLYIESFYVSLSLTLTHTHSVYGMVHGFVAVCVCF